MNLWVKVDGMEGTMVAGIIACNHFHTHSLINNNIQPIFYSSNRASHYPQDGSPSI